MAAGRGMVVRNVHRKRDAERIPEGVSARRGLRRRRGIRRPNPASDSSASLALRAVTPPAYLPRMSLLLRTSPHLSPLLDALAATLRHEPLPPRDMETIVVQSQGMRRWLTLQLADTFGCAGSLSLPFPASFVRELGTRIADDRLARDDRDPFSREALVWRIDALLRALPPGDATFQPLDRYLRDGDERRRFGLAAQVAARFDDYQMFRADVLDDWERGGNAPGGRHAAWQAALWRQLVAGAAVDGVPARHLATRLRNTIALLERAAPAGLPARVSVFGVSTLPPLFVDLACLVAV